MYIKKLLRVLDYGQFIKPFIDYFLNFSNTNIYDDEIKYLKAIKLKWSGNYNEALLKINDSLSTVNKKNIYYLLLIEKMDVLTKLSKKNEIKDVFIELKKGISRTPNYVRPLIIGSLNITREVYYDYISLEEVRTWSYEYDKFPVDKAYMFMAEARKKRNEKNYIESKNLNLDAFYILKDVPNPSGITKALNNICWWLRYENIELSLKFTFPLLFYLGYYFEDFQSKIFNTFDTVLTVQKRSNLNIFYDNIFIISKIYSNLNNDKKIYIKNKFPELIKYIDNYYLCDSPKYYKNTKNLRNFLKEFIFEKNFSIENMNVSSRTIKDFLLEKRDNIQSITLNKILKNLEFDFDIDLPIEVITEIKKDFIDNKFRKNAKRFFSLSKEKQFLELFISYLSNYYRNEINLLQIIKYINKDKLIKVNITYPLKQLINFIFYKYKNPILYLENDFKINSYNSFEFDSSSFYYGRKKLIEAFFNDFNKKYLFDFIKIYCNLSFQEKDVLEKFIRNYKRYDFKNIPKVMLPKSNKKFIPFIKKFGLNERLSSTSFWCFEEKDRKDFIEIINKFL
jgi:hypothetical protein